MSDRQAWAVGDYYNKAVAREEPLVERWTGRAWRVVPSPPSGMGSDFLLSVDGVSSSDVWAVGKTILPSYDIQPFLMHWNGTAWSILKPPDLPDYSSLTGVSALSTDDVWAVGYQNGGSTDEGALVLHWNGLAWSAIPSPTPGVYGGLDAVAARSAGEVWAVGYYREGDEYETLVMRWNGIRWRQVESPNASDYSFLHAVTLSPSGEVWAVGEAGDGVEATPLIEQWDGSVWSVVPSPEMFGTYNALTGAVVRATNDVWAVGAIDDQHADSFTLIEHWDGSAWTVVDSPDRPDAANYLNGIDVGADGTLWSVGETIPEQCCDYRTLALRGAS